MHMRMDAATLLLAEALEDAEFATEEHSSEADTGRLADCAQKIIVRQGRKGAALIATIRDSNHSMSDSTTALRQTPWFRLFALPEQEASG